MTNGTGNGDGNGDQVQVPRDWRAVIVVATGLLVILGGALAAILSLPAPVSKDEIDNASQSTVAIASAGFSAVAAVVSAYFGVKAANLAREDSTKAAERNTIRAAHLAGASPDQAATADQSATQSIKELGLI
jgi:uncharacterized membrane protein YgaE (UPF0421/DUF939 family)